MAAVKGLRSYLAGLVRAVQEAKLDNRTRFLRQQQRKGRL